MQENQTELNNALVMELLKEKRTERRWRMLRFVLWIVFLAWVIGSCMSAFKSKVPTSLGAKHVALIRLDGMIAPQRSISAENVVPVLREVFEDKNVSGIVIDINSPGGTPVQAAIIHDAILAFKQKYHKKVIVVGEDMLTSGAYFISVAADKIYVNPNTLTGSIGVVMKGFGFVDAMKKLGIERRVYTIGSAKDRLDPFLPQNPEDLKKIQSVMSEVHQNFQNAVITGRKGKLKETPDKLFNGDFWSGQTAMKLGLVDALGNLLDVMTIEFKDMEYKEYGDSSSWLHLLSGEFRTAVDSIFLS